MWEPSEDGDVGVASALACTGAKLPTACLDLAQQNPGGQATPGLQLVFTDGFKMLVEVIHEGR